jgi:hypothetical protein
VLYLPTGFEFKLRGKTVGESAEKVEFYALLAQISMELFVYPRVNWFYFDFSTAKYSNNVVVMAVFW